MSTDTKDSGWGFANGGRTDKAHFFAPGAHQSACGRFLPESVIFFSPDKGQATSIDCGNCLKALGR